MKNVFFSPESLKDLDEIWLYIAQDNISQADLFIDKLQALCEGKLTMFPKMGRSRNYLEKGVLAFPYHSYMIYYRENEGDSLEIIRIMHGSVDVESVFA
jgi:plasmid stabilization system protein ParE